MNYFRIRNKETGEFWEKSIDSYNMWTSESVARGLFTRYNKRYGDGRSWGEQDEYEIVEFILVEKEEYENWRELEETTIELLDSIDELIE